MYQYPGYFNSYQPRFGELQRAEVPAVTGKNGAEAYALPPNSSVLLLDNSAPVVWLKVTDGAGYPTVTGYKIEPLQAQQQPDFNALENRIARLEAVINGKSDIGSTRKQDAAGQYNAATDE